MISYAIEFHDHTGERFSRPERQNLTRQRAHEIALAYCRAYPTHMCFIYCDVEKDHGYSQKTRLKRTASRVETVARVFGESYPGRRTVASTMMRKSRGRTDRAEMQIPTLVAKRSRTW